MSVERTGVETPHSNSRARRPLMIRELVLVSGDLSATRWFASRTPPVPRLPAGISLETATDERLFAKGPISPKQAGERLSEGDTCVVAVSPEIGLAAQMWCTERTRYIDWIGCDIRPPDGHVHVYNSWVEPEFRGLGLHWSLAAAACGTVVERGRTHLCAGVERKEYAPFARKYAAMGLALLAPYKSIWSLRVWGVTAAAVSARPPRVLEVARLNASKILAGRAEQG